uniref:Uncharacterized protein n=1 Tax=Schistocephalus solidus TaxID=70667 RepID=A0A0X3PM99_SCHSO
MGDCAFAVVHEGHRLCKTTAHDIGDICIGVQSFKAHKVCGHVSIWCVQPSYNKEVFMLGDGQDAYIAVAPGRSEEPSTSQLGEKTGPGGDALVGLASDD